jgi:hypothetical protein
MTKRAAIGVLMMHLEFSLSEPCAPEGQDNREEFLTGLDAIAALLQPSKPVLILPAWYRPVKAVSTLCEKYGHAVDSEFADDLDKLCREVADQAGRRSNNLTEPLPEFTAHGPAFNIAGRGWSFAVALDRETRDFAHLTGKDVRINGFVHRCIGVERFLHNPPWRRGEMVGLLVKDYQE